MLFINSLICQNNYFLNLRKLYFCAYYATYIKVEITFLADFSISGISQYLRNSFVLIVPNFKG